MKYAYLVLGTLPLASCQGFMDAFGSAVAETPNVGEVAGQAVGTAVEVGLGGGGPLGGLIAGLGVLGTTLGGIAIRTIRNLNKKPSRAAPQIEAVEARLAALETPRSDRRAGD